MNNKKMNVGEASQQYLKIEGIDKYLASGNGHGRLNSAATIYDGKVGYFFVGMIDVGGVKQESILFSCEKTDHGVTTNNDIVITKFPPTPKNY